MLPSRLIVLITLAALSGPTGLLHADPFRYPEAKHGQGELRYINGLPVLQLAGTPEQIAEQEAVLAIKPAERLLNYPKDVLAALGAESMWPWFIKLGAGLLDQFPPGHRAEFEALVKAGVDRELLIAGNTMFDIKKFFACSALVVEATRSGTGGPLFGRNLDFPTIGYLQEFSLVKVYRPAGKHAFVSIGFPGLIGCLSGMNERGLSLAVLEVFAAGDGSKKFEETGTPYAICYRRILEECSTVEEAEKLLRSMSRTTRMNLAVCDRQTSAVFEMTPKTLAVRRAVNGLCPCTNHFIAEGTAASVGNAFRTRERLKKLQATDEAVARFQPADLHRALHEVNQKQHTLQTMIFEPATLRLHLAIGSCPSSALPLKVLDLKPLLGEGDR